MQTFTKLTRPLNQYLFAATGVVIAAGIRYLLYPLMGSDAPLLIFTLPVILSALYGGFGPAVFSTLLSATLGAYLFINGTGISDFNTANQVRIVMFLCIGFTAAFLGKKLRQSQFRTLQSQEHLRSTAEQLREANAQLKEANAQLREAGVRKDEFLAMLAHELRNPLAGISTAAELLKFVKLDENRLVRTSGVITRQVQHMSKLVDDLLDVSRMTRGLITITKQPLDMVGVVHGAVEQIQLLIDQHGHRLTLRLPEAPAWTMGDHTRMVQVIANLLNNAAKYSPKGSEIVVQIAVSQDWIEMEVQDNGQGLSPKLLPHIFDSFVQAERTPDRSQGGLGLGLAIAKSIVDLHGGRISAHSGGPGTGSRFTVCLPLLKTIERTAVEPQSGRPTSIATNSLHILVVDDNRDAAHNLGLLLEIHGHSAVIEFDAGAALDRVHGEEFDALILDIGLPGMDGYELARRLRQIPFLSKSVLIALTGYGQEEDKRRAKEAGFDHHFTKPVDMAKLVTVLAQAGLPNRHR